MNTHINETVHVVQVSVFPAAVMEAIFGHSDFWTVEYRGFVHIVPYHYVVVHVIVFQLGIKTFVIVENGGIEKVRIAA